MGDFRFREVKHSLIPKERTIEKLNSELRRLEAEFERQLTVQRDMEAALESKKGQILRLTKEGERLREVIKKRDNTIFRFTSDLDALVQNEQDLRLWPHGLLKIYKDHVDPKSMVKDDNTFAMQELQRQIAVMERKVSTLAAQGRQTDAACRSSIQKETRDNSLLIKEVNEIRVEQKVLEKRTKELELKVRQAENKVAQHKEKREAALALAASAVPGSTERPRLGNAELDEYFDGATSDGASTSVMRARPRQQRKSVAPVAPEPAAGRSIPMMSLVRRPKSRGSLVEERKTKHKLLLDADQTERAVQQKALENKLLKDQLQKLMLEDGGDSDDKEDGTSRGRSVRPAKPTAAAGAGLAAVRAGANAGTNVTVSGIAV